MAPRNNRTPLLLSCSTRKTEPCHGTYCDKSDMLNCRWYTYFVRKVEKYYFLSWNTLLLQRSHMLWHYLKAHSLNTLKGSKLLLHSTCFTMISHFHNTIISVTSLIYTAKNWYCLKAKELYLMEAYSNRSQCWVKSFNPLSLYREAHISGMEFSRQK